MLKHFITLERKAFTRSASFNTNMALKIIMGLLAFIMVLYFLGLGFGVYFIIEDHFKLVPFDVINNLLVFYVVGDLVIKYFLQKMPVVNIKPLLYLPLKKKQIVSFGINKTIVSFYNIIHCFFFIPFSIILITKGHDVLGVIAWHLAIMALIYSNNFINIFVNSKNSVFYSVLGLLVVFGALKYFLIFDITRYTSLFFKAFYTQPYLVIIPIALTIMLYKMAYNYFKANLYLDAVLEQKIEEVESDEMNWLNRFGSVSTFLKNDIKLLKRNKRSKTTMFMSVLFLFYGLLFFTGSVEAYKGPLWQIFAGMFVSGGFLFTFGQFVPSWDSAYYQLLMSQNIKYKTYLESKWYLMVIATIVSTILASFYLYIGWQAYLAVIAGAIYNIGVNAYMVLWGGAYVKTPIDLTSSKNAFGDKKSFNLKTILLTIPKMLLPMLIYALGHYTYGEQFGFLLVILAGIIGFLFKNKVFKIIEKLYQTEKYKTIAAYKQKN